MIVGYNIANPPGYTHNPLIRVGQSITATYHGTSRNFLVTGILNEAGNPNVDQVVIINTNTGNTFFHRLGQYDLMIVFARAYIAPIFLPNELVQVWLLSLTVTLLAGLFPAWKASRLSPLIAMRV
jgi:ABC-type antimicrobial peptide transport system permease subunit